MSKRREPRKEVETSVRVFGTDTSGKVFSEKVTTVNISQHGVELSGVSVHLTPDDIVGLSYANNRVHFRVKWVGKPGTPKEGHVGLLNISPGKPLWDFALPAPAPDHHRPTIVEGRKHPRFKCPNSIELHSEAGASFWATIADLSVGGCYIEMALPFPKGSKVKVGIWIGETKVWADGEVAHSAPGLGIGVKFTGISDAHLQRLRQFLDTLGPFARKR
jgi:hypothetical protein